MDFFEQLINKIDSKRQYINIIDKQIEKRANDYSFSIFKYGINDSVKEIYNKYNKFVLSWECEELRVRGFVDFVPYKNIALEHNNLWEEIKEIEEDMIEDQEKVINDISHWYPVFVFPNGDKFCFDDRNGKIVFFEHDVFDCGVNLHGLVIADSLDDLFDVWSKVLFVDIYDWDTGVNENGIDLNKKVYMPILHLFS